MCVRQARGESEKGGRRPSLRLGVAPAEGLERAVGVDVRADKVSAADGVTMSERVSRTNGERTHKPA